MRERLLAIKERLIRIAPRIGFPAFYLFCLVLFASWTFPFQRLKERIVVSFNAGQRSAGSPQELQVDDATSSWITGVRLRGIRLSSPSAEPGKPPSELKIDDATLRISMLGLLIGNKDVTYRVSAFGGTIDGSYDDRGKTHDFDVNFDSVDVGQITPLVEAIGLPMEGTLQGSMNLETSTDEEKGPKPNGAISLEIHDLAVGDGKAKLRGALALPRVNVGTLTLSGEAKEGVLTIKKFNAGGKDLELVGDGRVQLRDTAIESSVDVNVRFKINDGYRTKSDVTKTLFGAPGSKESPLFELADPKVKQSKRVDGFYGWHVRGQLGHPDFAPAGSGSALGNPGFRVVP